MNYTRTFDIRLLTRWWKHVQVHSYNHRDEYQGVINEVKLNPWYKELNETHRDWSSAKIVSDNGLYL